MDMIFKDIAEAMTEAASLDNERIKAFNDLRKDFDVISKICEIINLRDRYSKVLHWLYITELIKGFYTDQDSNLFKQCLAGMTECDNKLGTICYKYTEDKVQSELLHYLFGKNK